MRTSSERLNTLGLDERTLNALLDKLERQSPDGHVSRNHTRWGYRQTSVDVRIIQPAGIVIDTQLACRNLSKTGIGLLHRSYVHVGTTCIVTIDCPVRGRTRIPGTVARCMHVSGIVHEIGVQFDEEIDIRAIVRPDPMIELSAIENVDSASLSGTIIIVEDCGMSLQLIKHYLRETQLRIREAATVAEAEELAKDDVVLVLCDIHLEDENGGELAKRLFHSPASTPPIIMMSTDQGIDTRGLVDHPGIDGFLAKPFTQEMLLRTVAEFLRKDNAEPNKDGKTGYEVDRKVVDALLPELTKCAGDLEAAAGESNDALRSILLRMSGVAPVLGISDLATRIETLAAACTGPGEIEDLHEQIASIVEICERASGGT